ncbi:hypothetical protein CCACVL1_12806 [Corchorus capsularis]|uniref:CASP-like protein n=1 Tax=Corchorus capsularis TaxID=210143 RepID=A0A1R3IDW1_COCAP|nr:hypothetical protein CCACVL1_12806 [Corchorus capsularis]
MENDKPRQHLQQQQVNQTHHHQEEEEQKQVQQHQKHQEEEKQNQQQQQNQEHEEEENHHQLEEEEEEAENKQNHKASQFPLSKRTPPRSPIPKALSPASDDNSHIDSPLSSDSSLSHGFSPPPQATSQSQPSQPNSKPPPPAVAVSTAEFSSRDQSIPTTATTVEVEVEEQRQKLGSGSGKRLRPDLSILRRAKRDKMVRKALLGFRISGFVFCLISFSVLAADRDKGWALDSFYRYKEFRFCMAVNVIGFVYSGIQAYDLAYQLTSGKQKPRTRLRCYLDFVLDQVLAYLLISASSSAAVRVDDWQSNWGKDKFPEMARASMALSLVAFIALALSSLVSGYTLSTYR